MIAITVGPGTAHPEACGVDVYLRHNVRKIQAFDYPCGRDDARIVVLKT